MRQLALLRTLVPAALLLAAPASAQTVRIDFHEYASPTTAEYRATVGMPLTAGGLDFYETVLVNGNASRNVLGTWGSDPSDPASVNRPANLGPSTALFATGPGLEIDVVGAGSDLILGHFIPFNLFTIDIAHLYSNPYFPTALSPFTIQFFGWNGQSVFSQAFDIAAPQAVNGTRTPELQTLTFDERFRNVYNVWWSQGANSTVAHQFTNVTTGSVVPEPVSMVLLGTGLAGVAAARRRRRREDRAAEA